MANFVVKDGAGDTKELKATGVGSAGDPFILEQRPAPLGQAAMAASVPVTIASNQSMVEVAVRSRMVQGTFTRPSNTTGYSADDIMNDSASAPTALFVDACVRANGGYGQLVGAMVTDSNNATTKAVLELWIFNDAYTLANDNAAFVLADADLEDKLVAVIFLGGIPAVGNNGAAAAGNCVYQWNADPGRGGIPFKCGASSQKLYYALVHRASYTPVSAEKFVVKFSVVQE